MRLKAVANQFEGNGGNQQQVDQFYSVEFSLNQSKLIYQFKVWNNESNYMFAIAKEGSVILEGLNVGDIFNMKYYSSNPSCPITNMNTRISCITKEDTGRFKGHYIIGLSIAEKSRFKVAN